MLKYQNGKQTVYKVIELNSYVFIASNPYEYAAMYMHERTGTPRYAQAGQA